MIAGRVQSLETVFKYELTTKPMSLFKDGMMRKPNKPSLVKAVMSEAGLVEPPVNPCNVTVMDGGALLHKVRWMKGALFLDIFRRYSAYISKNYINPTVVSNGYGSCTTKDHEHFRRNAIPQSSFISIDPNNEMPFTQDRYFSLTDNKVEFIKFLSNHLKEAGVNVFNCSGDADCKIVEVALQFSKSKDCRTLVVADIFLLQELAPLVSGALAAPR